jgi:alcohol dehydrogenase (NADP+)
VGGATCTVLLTTPKTAVRARENLNISVLPEDAFNEINYIRTRQRLNEGDRHPGIHFTR